MAPTANTTDPTAVSAVELRLRMDQEPSPECAPTYGHAVAQRVPGASAPGTRVELWTSVSYAQLTAGTAVASPPVPRNPNVVVPFAPSEPFQDMFVTVTFEPLVLSWPLHSWVMV